MKILPRDKRAISGFCVLFFGLICLVAWDGHKADVKRMDERVRWNNEEKAVVSEFLRKYRYVSIPQNYVEMFAKEQKRIADDPTSLPSDPVVTHLLFEIEAQLGRN